MKAAHFDEISKHINKMAISNRSKNILRRIAYNTNSTVENFNRKIKKSAELGILQNLSNVGEESFEEICDNFCITVGYKTVQHKHRLKEASLFEQINEL